MPNRLIHSNSPYLLQHSHNPVDWYPWGEEALSRAKKEDKLIFLSIGYMACHWCHVMERESFEDSAVAAILNEHFIPIKVDREERPDLDAIYMAATVGLTGQGGWPMSVFLSPDLQPFYAGTYFPPRPMPQRPSFTQVLNGMIDIWSNQREEVYRVGGQVSLIVQSLQNDGPNDGSLSMANLEDCVSIILRSADEMHGGWGNAPKFPQPMAIQAILAISTLGNERIQLEAKEVVTKTLYAMARGGMHDLVGGGFCRYSVDDHWLIPHFEKMLYDNAQLAQAYLDGYLATQNKYFEQVCRSTLDFILRELTGAQGAFFSSLDADSDGEEGSFYTFTNSELRIVLADEYPLIQAAYNLRENGNWEGKTILQRATDPLSLSANFSIPAQELERRLEDCLAKLYEYRAGRARPATDDKALASWNGLALAAFSRAGLVLNEPRYIEAAQQNATFISTELIRDGKLYRSWRAGDCGTPAFLEDHAAVALGLVSLWQADGDSKWYWQALSIADEMVNLFWDGSGCFYDTRISDPGLLLRPRSVQDNATPSGGALAALALATLGQFGDRQAFIEIAQTAINTMAQKIQQAPLWHAKWLQAAGMLLAEPQTVAIVSGNARNFEQVLFKSFRPYLLIAQMNETTIENNPAILVGKAAIDGLPTVYVCRGNTCQLPVTQPSELASLLRS